jgi:two-component system nitrogen regulation response regulator GlnG
MLFRVLDDKEILSMGTSQPVKVDVRVVAATDRNLEELVEKQQFERSLYNRLESAVSIGLAPLRERREDVGCLLVHFLRKAVGDAAELQRLLDELPPNRPWLWASDVAAVASSSLPGNARDLQGLAGNLLDKASDPPYDTHLIVKGFLGRRDPGSSQKDASTVKPLPLAEIPDERILALFERFHGNREDVARYLGKTRVTLWRRIRKSSKLKQIIEERWPR